MKQDKKNQAVENVKYFNFRNFYLNNNSYSRFNYLNLRKLKLNFIILYFKQIQEIYKQSFGFYH